MRFGLSFPFQSCSPFGVETGVAHRWVASGRGATLGLLCALLTGSCAKQISSPPKADVSERGRDSSPSEAAQGKREGSNALSGSARLRGGSPELPEPSEEPSFGARRPARLSVEGFAPADLWIPEGGGAQTMRLLVVAHGAGGRGVDHCAHWDRLVPADVALLCLAGKPLRTAEPEGGAYFSDHFALRRELRAALQAASENANQLRPAEERWFLGYSQGATMGALAIVGEMEMTHLLLIEGGGESFTHQRARAFANLGGRSVFFACGTKGCAAHAERSISVLESVDVEAAAFVDLSAGHAYWTTLGPPAADRMTRAAAAGQP